MKRIIINLGLLPEEPCGDWDRDRSSVTDEDGNRIGYVDVNDGEKVTIVVEDQIA
jgi:hypothetical protein